MIGPLIAVVVTVVVVVVAMSVAEETATGSTDVFLGRPGPLGMALGGADCALVLLVVALSGVEDLRLVDVNGGGGVVLLLGAACFVLRKAVMVLVFVTLTLETTRGLVNFTWLLFDALVAPGVAVPVLEVFTVVVEGREVVSRVLGGKLRHVEVDSLLVVLVVLLVVVSDDLSVGTLLGGVRIATVLLIEELRLPPLATFSFVLLLLLSLLLGTTVPVEAMEARAAPAPRAFTFRAVSPDSILRVVK
ncbi:hypothetical protein KQX54_002170 [Cotesia glomerata]|uniref:Uncharacterized protein n=1 Tax=Cotesia glomerata TaxID=32391 RepID=A0AAV7I0H3_COTGL|nr:hypothetical protein KQX54_002170 [Cotesia glomerata]